MKETSTYSYQEKIGAEWALGNWGQARALVAPVKSLDEPLRTPANEKSEMTRGDLLPDPVSVEEDVVGRLNYEEMVSLLPIPLQQVVRLNCEFGYTSDQIGKIIGIKGGTVRVRMGKALRILRGKNKPGFNINYE